MSDKTKYKEYVEYLRTKNFYRQKINITNSSTLYLTKDKNLGTFEIRCPAGCKLVLPFVDTIDTILEYGFNLKLVNKEGKEMSGDTNLKIYTRKPSGLITTISDILYYNIRHGGSTMYHPMIGIELNGEDKLIFELVNYKIDDINFEKCELYANMDLFTMY